MTLEELREQVLADMTLGTKPASLYDLLKPRVDKALRAAEQRGIERAANLMFLQGHESVISTKQAYNAIRALAQGGEE